jgi:hypothetical protein
VNISNPKSHLAFVLIGLSLLLFTNCPTTSELSLLPAWLSALICHQASRTNLLGRNELIFHEDD